MAVEARGARTRVAGHGPRDSQVVGLEPSRGAR